MIGTLPKMIFLPKRAHDKLEVYELLDEETRRRIEADAAEMFGEDMVERQR